MSLLVVMGSGETAPTMVKIHREVFAASGPGLAVLLDTPFAFQMNADDLVAKTKAYFADSVGTPVEVASWRRADAPLVDAERALARLHEARWAFAGPGSPTYALRQWRGTALPEALLDVCARGGTLVFGSAAACTLGTHSIPVYEIYKVGADPHWEVGLDLLGRLTGLRAVVVPHYDNREGGEHDTNFCYLGEQRLAAMEAQLPDDVGVLGVDEHTALVLDLTARSGRVLGNGVVSIRRRSTTTTFPAGAQLGFDALDALLRGERVVVEAGDGEAAPGGAAAAVHRPAADHTPSLRTDAEAARLAFDAAVQARDADAAVAAILELEAAIHAWGADTLQSDDADHARRILRALVVRLGDLARDGVRDPREVLKPLVSLLLDVRGRARSAKDYTTSDLVRDGLVAAGVEVRDTPDGVHWGLIRPPGNLP